MSTNWALLMAMHDSGLRQRDFARVAGDHESLISRVVNGVWNLDEILQTRYAKALGKRIEDLFLKGSPSENSGLVQTAFLSPAALVVGVANRF